MSYQGRYHASEYYKACNIPREDMFAALLLACGPPPPTVSHAFQDWMNVVHRWMLALQPAFHYSDAIERYEISLEFRQWWRHQRYMRHDYGKAQ